VIFAAYRIGTRALGNPVLWSIAALAFLGIFVFELPFPAVVATAASIGVLGGRLAPSRFAAGGATIKSVFSDGESAVIGDETPSPHHARVSRGRPLVVVGLGFVLWALGIIATAGMFGTTGPPAQMAWFFSKAALVTFGGAYAVLPYVFQGAVEAQGWLTTSQMIDGLALGETTPGQRST